MVMMNTQLHSFRVMWLKQCERLPWTCKMVLVTTASVEVTNGLVNVWATGGITAEELNTTVSAEKVLSSIFTPKIFMATITLLNAAVGC